MKHDWRRGVLFHGPHDIAPYFSSFSVFFLESCGLPEQHSLSIISHQFHFPWPFSSVALLDIVIFVFLFSCFLLLAFQSWLSLPFLPSFPFLLSYRSTWLPALTFRVFSPSFLLFFSGVAGEEIKIGLQKLTPIWGLRGNLTQVWSSRELHFTLWCWISRFNNGQKKAKNSAGLS